VYYPKNALRNTTHMACKNSYLFRHQDVIIRELLIQWCTTQPANTNYVSSYKYM